jgi:PAS domain S-box-containing protein
MIRSESTSRVVRVLLVGGAEGDRLALRRLLAESSGAGSEVAEASDLAQAKAAIARARPDCVLLDGDAADGALGELRTIVADYGIHAFGIVLLADPGASVDAVKALENGAHDFLLKGQFDADRLQQAVRNAVEKAAGHHAQEAGRAELVRRNDELESRLIHLEREATERRSAELTLASSQAFLQSVVSATTDCVKVLDLDGRILWMSENGQRMMEIADFSVIDGTEWAQLWGHSGKTEQARAAVAAARDGKVARFQGCRLMPGGIEKWWDVSLSPINGRKGRAERILCVSRDVSDRHVADVALRESEARLRLATATGKVGVWDWDILADKVTWTDSLYGIHGMNPGTFDGTLAAFAKLIHSEDRARVEQAFYEALTGGGPHELEFRALRPDGGVVWLFTNATVVHEDGRPVRMLGATLDVTERKRAEQHTEFLAQLGQQLDLLSDPDEMVRVAQEAVGRHLDVQRCSFFEVDETGVRAVIRDDWRKPGLEGAGGEYLLDEYGSPGFVKRLAQARFSVSDVAEDPLTKDRAESHLRMGTRAFATAPYYQDGRWIAGLAVLAGEPRHWREDELNLLEQAVVRVWPHVEKARADRLLIDSAEQLKLAASAARLGPWSYDAFTDIVTLSPRGAEIFGIPPGPFMTWTQMRELLHDEDRERAREAVECSLADRTEYAIEYRVIRPDGTTVWVASTGHGQYDADGRLFGMVGVVQDITSRKEAERAMWQLAVIVESSDDAIVSKNLDGVVLTWNTGAERLFGYKAHEIIGLPIIVLIPPENYNEEPFILERIRRGEPVESYETVRRHKSGRMLDVSLTVSPIRDKNGVIVGASKIARDISRRKAIENALARRTRTLEILNRAGNALVAERELEKVVRTIADAGREISGAGSGGLFCNSLDEKTGYADFYTFSGERRVFERRPVPRDDALLGPVVRGEGLVRIDDVQAGAADGGSLPDSGMPGELSPVRSFLAAPVKSGSGEILGGLFFAHAESAVFTQEMVEVIEALAAQAAIAIDNVRLHRAVQRELAEHKLAREAVRAREEQLRLVTNNAPVFLLQCDREYRYTFANQPYAARYGFTPETLLGRTIAEVAGPKAFEMAKHHIDAAFAGERVEFEMEIPYDMIGARWVHLVFVPERNPDGQVLGFVGVLTDITQRKSAELELERARDEALAASRAKDDFLAALSHELRTPLNPVLLLASDAAENPALPAEIRESFETIRRQVNLEARLIDDLLDLTRITRGKLSLERRALDVHAVIRDAVTTVRPDLETKKLTLAMHLDATKYSVFGDPVRLQQVFWNVLKNAVKFTGEGGDVTVRTGVGKKGDRLVVTVEDTGIGMTISELGRVFDAFSQGEHATAGGSHRFGGLGLGLAISRSIVEMHGGRIRAESPGRNRGAVFIVELPLMNASTPDEQTGGNDRAGVLTRTVATNGKRGRLLVIEDHAPTRATLKSLLERRNFEVFSAGNAVEARELVQRQPVDLVISDIGLPDVDGCTLMAELRSAHPLLPGIALSGYGMDEDIARTRAVGFVEHLTKPVNVGALERAIERIFSGKS